MIPSTSKPTRTTIFLAGFSAVCVVGAVALRTLRPVAANTNDPTLTTLNAQMSELAPYSTLARASAKEERAAAENRLWTPDRLNAWRATVPAGWRVQEIAPQPAVFTTQRRFLLSSPGAAFKDWPDIVAFLEATADRPALRILSLTITAPAGSKRNFTQLSLLLGFASAKPDHNPNHPAE